MIAFYSSASGNTARFVERLSLKSVRIGGDMDSETPIISTLMSLFAQLILMAVAKVRCQKPLSKC